MSSLPVMSFEMNHLFFSTEVSPTEKFTSENPPDWLGNRSPWFWNERVLTLDVGASVETNVSIILRVS
jgi:hypothetical protein